MRLTPKLGRLAPARNPLVPKLKALLPNLPEAPTPVNWWADVPEWGMLGNDDVGDCVLAALSHATMALFAYNGTVFMPPTMGVIGDYSAVTGYDPKDPTSDQGTQIETALVYFKNTGLDLGFPSRHRIQAYASVNHVNLEEVKRALNLFGGLIVGVDLPLSAQDQDYVLDLVSKAGNAPNSWGGHCVAAVGCDDFGVDVISWGARYKMTWAFWISYVVEAHAILDPDFAPAGVTPADVPWDTLATAMAAL